MRSIDSVATKCSTQKPMKKTWTQKKLLGVVWPYVIHFVSSYALFIKLTIFKVEYQHLKSGEHYYLITICPFQNTN